MTLTLHTRATKWREGRLQQAEHDNKNAKAELERAARVVSLLEEAKEKPTASSTPSFSNTK